MSRMTPELHRRIESLLDANHPRKSIAAMVGMPLASVRRVAEGFYRNGGAPASGTKRAAAVLGKRAKGGQSKHADPTPDEIEEMCYRLRMARPDDDADGWLPPGVAGPLFHGHL